MPVQSQGIETTCENENENLSYGCGLPLNLKLMRLKAKSPMKMLRSMPTSKLWFCMSNYLRGTIIEMARQGYDDVDWIIEEILGPNSMVLALFCI